MNIPPKIVCLAFYMVLFFNLYAQHPVRDVRIMFYNVENLFDTYDDPQTDDEEFLPGKGRNWNSVRFRNKLAAISKVIMAVGGWETPDIIGMCEVENRYVVEQLLKRTPLGQMGYQIIHKESQDKRGIDVSLIYKKEKFNPFNYQYLEVKDQHGELLDTREILYVAGILENGDTVHLFYNHWPSRFGGYLETTALRELAAQTLRNAIDRLYLKHPDPKVIIMGDFNDQPDDESLVKVLLGGRPEAGLINLSVNWVAANKGTIKHQSQWQVFDQVIISAVLLRTDAGTFCRQEDAHILRSRFLLTEDKTYGGMKPFRTYSGFKYTGGFSDHLPVYLDLFFR